MTMIERRFNSENVEVKGKKISGMAAVFYDGTPSTEYTLWDNASGKAVERIERGSFNFSNDSDQTDVICVFDHNQSLLLGRSKNNTLKLKEVERGLYYECEPNDTTIYRDARKLISNGLVTGSSFKMRITKESWTKEGDVSVRHIEQGNLEDVSPVIRACYTGSSSMVRGKELDSIKDSHKKWIEEISTQEKILWSESL